MVPADRILESVLRAKVRYIKGADQGGGLWVWPPSWPIKGGPAPLKLF